MRAVGALVAGSLLWLGAACFGAIADPFAVSQYGVTDVVRELQSIPLGAPRTYQRGDTQHMPMEAVLDGLILLGIAGFDVEDASVDRENQETGEIETYIGGDFGFMIKECVMNYLPGEDQLLVIHREFKPHPRYSPKYDTEVFELWINDRVTKVELVRGYFPVEKGLDWGLSNLLLTEWAYNDAGAWIGTKETELALDFYVYEENPKPAAYFTIRAYDTTHTLLAYEEYQWEVGNSSVAGHRPWGPPTNAG